VVVFLGSSLVEVVHVELSDEGSQVVVLEVGGKHLGTELNRHLDDNGGSFGVPVDNVGESLVFKHLVGLADEGGDDVGG